MLKGIANNLTKDQIQQLESIGFNQNSQTKTQANIKWIVQFDLLKQYKKEYGTCNVPASYASNESLKNWVQTQRTQYRYMVQGFPTELTKKRRNLLESIGFDLPRQNQTVKQIEESKIMANDDEKMEIEGNLIVSQPKTLSKRKKKQRNITDECTDKYVLISPTKNEKPDTFRQMMGCKELETNDTSYASVGKSECNAQIDRKVRHDEQIVGEGSCTKSRRETVSKRKLEIGKSTDYDSYKLLTPTSDKGSESIIRNEVHWEQNDSEIRKNNEEFIVEESQTETIDESCTSLQDKIQILCKISILFQEEKDAAHATIKKRKLDNSSLIKRA